MRYGEVEIERGGIISGQIDVIAASNTGSEATPAETPSTSHSEPETPVSASVTQGELSVS